MNSPIVRLWPQGRKDSINLSPRRLIVAGYTARDETAVRAHIDELAAIGVPRPESVPAFYELDPRLLSTAENVAITGPNTSGEVEPVLFRHGETFYLGVGSDHTDRDLERDDIGKAKSACPKPIGTQVVALPTESEWDGIQASCAVDGRPYQSGPLSVLRRPDGLMASMAAALGQIDDDLVLFAGTLPLLGGEFVAGTDWQLRLQLPDGNELFHSYHVE